MYSTINKWFSDAARYIADKTGQPLAFSVALLMVLVWLFTGPLFRFSDTWQLVINTGSSIVTFLMVFLIQKTQNRDSAAIHIKLDELIRAHEEAHNSILDSEELTEEQLILIKGRYEKLATRARQELKKGKLDTEIADV